MACYYFQQHLQRLVHLQGDRAPHGRRGRVRHDVVPRRQSEVGQRWVLRELQPAFDVWQTSTPPPSTWRHTAGAPPNVHRQPAVQRPEEHAVPVRPDPRVGRRGTRRGRAHDRVPRRLHDLRRGRPVGREHQREQRPGRRRSNVVLGHPHRRVDHRLPPLEVRLGAHRGEVQKSQLRLLSRHDLLLRLGLSPGLALQTRRRPGVRATDRGSRLSGRPHGAAEPAVPLRADAQCDARRSRGRRQRLRLQRRRQGVRGDLRGGNTVWDSGERCYNSGLIQDSDLPENRTRIEDDIYGSAPCPGQDNGAAPATTRPTTP